MIVRTPVPAMACAFRTIRYYTPRGRACVWACIVQSIVDNTQEETSGREQMQYNSDECTRRIFNKHQWRATLV